MHGRAVLTLFVELACSSSCWLSQFSCRFLFRSSSATMSDLDHGFLSFLMSDCGLCGMGLFAVRGGYSAQALWGSQLKIVQASMPSAVANPLRMVFALSELSGLSPSKDLLCDASEIKSICCLVSSIARLDFLICLPVRLSHVAECRDDSARIVAKVLLCRGSGSTVNACWAEGSFDIRGL